jgi:hypothetical protein
VDMQMDRSGAHVAMIPSLADDKKRHFATSEKRNPGGVR